MSSLSGNRGAAGGNLQGYPAGGNIVPKGYKQGQLQQYGPEQMRLFQQLFSQVSPDSYLSKLAGGDESTFGPMEQRSQRDFQGALGQLGSRYSQLAPGAMSAQRGSSFQNASGQLASDFALDLSARRQDLQRQALQDLLGISGTLLGQRPTEQFLIGKPSKQSSGWGGAIGAGLGAVGGFFAGGPAGALAGGTLGYNVGSKF